MKTEVITICDDSRYNEFKAGERGYIDGFVVGGDHAPYAAVVIGERIILISTTQLKVVIKPPTDKIS